MNMLPQVVILFAFVALFTLAIKADQIKILSVQECEPPLDLLDYEVQFETGEDSVDIVSGVFRTPIDVNGGDLFITLQADKLVDDDWLQNVFLLKDKEFFPFINFIAGPTWTNFRQQVTPKIEEFDHIPAGDYKIEGFRASYSDIVTIPLNGRYLWTLTVTISGTDVACVRLDTEI